MTVEVTIGSDGIVETAKLSCHPQHERDLQVSVAAHIALGYFLDGRSYNQANPDGTTTLFRLLTRPAPPVEEEDEEVDATAAALALAAEEGLDLSLVEGSGSGGRIGVGDVRDFLEDLDAAIDEELSLEAELIDESEEDEEVPSSEDEGPEEEVDDAPLPFEEEDSLLVEEIDGSIEELEEGE